MIRAMEFTVRFDRKIEKDKHYISPGGYSVNGKRFDFCAYEGCIDNEDPTLLHATVHDFDEEFFNESNENAKELTASDFLQSFDEFYIYTGESNEPEIIPKEILSLTIYYDYGKNIIERSFGKSVLENATKALATG